MLKIIAIDFDGTTVSAEGRPDKISGFVLQPFAKEVLQWMYPQFFLILWTCRDDVYLQAAVDFLRLQNIEFHAINENAPFLDFKTSNKIFADKYVDDRAGFKNWLTTKQELIDEFLINDETIITKVVEKYLC
ncbi:MAG: hypothetical protein Q7R33_05295 [Nitrosarchaeum sp.]|nr:hypothetical protein [Nitrosarchaeum sp.]